LARFRPEKSTAVPLTPLWSRIELKIEVTKKKEKRDKVLSGNVEGNAWQVGAWRLGFSISFTAPVTPLAPAPGNAPSRTPSIGLALPAGKSYNNFCHSLSCRRRAISYLLYLFFDFILLFFLRILFFLGGRGACQ